MVSCTKDFEDLNENPNQPTNVPPSYLLISAQKGLMNNLWDDWWNGRFGLLYSQYWSQAAYTDESRYQPRDNNTNTYWLMFYAGTTVSQPGSPAGGSLMDLQTIIDMNTDPETADEVSVYGSNNNQIAVARILKAWMFHIMTDIWGDIPYFEALQGADNPSPAFTPQRDIYMDLLKELKEAAAQIEVGELGVEGDNIYNGDMEKWRRFANSLRMRVALRMIDVEEAIARDEIADAAPGAFQSNDDNALFRYESSVPNNNPLNEARKTRRDFVISEPLVDMLKDKDDPRLTVYAAPTENDPNAYEGFPYGLSANDAAALDIEDYSEPPTATVIAANAPGILMLYDEVKFILAEVNMSETDFEEGVEASLEFWGDEFGGISQTDISAYMTLNYTAYTLTKEMIWREKYIALYMQGIQGWSLWRRTGNPPLDPPAAGSLVPLNNTIIPTRMTYPRDEQLLNRENYQEAVQRQGPDRQDTKLWWDVN